ncbi:hypothetical protein SO802_025146 [Lithocarpus litseifolius]|uniref:Uncharacterized protein n=1 Tax=Lithocarpus litseifolius TaxID=425828 RepID=A0AAW2BXP5_9ROSI
MRKLLQNQILGSKKANKKGAPVTTLSEDNRLASLIYVNEQFNGWKVWCLRILQRAQALELRLPFGQIEVLQENLDLIRRQIGLEEVEILSATDPDALAKAATLV